MNLRIDFSKVMSAIKLWEDKISVKLPFKTVLTICVIVILWQLSVLKDEIYSIKREVSVPSSLGGLGSLGGFGEDVESDVSSIKRDISSMESDISSMESDISSIKRDISSIENDVSSMKWRL